jgi:hypothetical protein
MSCLRASTAPSTMCSLGLVAHSLDKVQIDQLAEDLQVLDGP